MEEYIYMLPDGEICRKIGDKLKKIRLRQNITQMDLAQQCQISVSTVKKIENGEIGSFDSFLRIIRVLGELDGLTSFMKEEEMSPNEYLEFLESQNKKSRKRAHSTNKNKTFKNPQTSEW